jgi:hypothetical protein
MTRERQAAALGVESVRKAYSKIIDAETEKPDRIMQKAMAGVGYERISDFFREEMADKVRISYNT